MDSESETISAAEIKILDELFDLWERVSIRTKEDIIVLSETFDEDE